MNKRSDDVTPTKNPKSLKTEGERENEKVPDSEIQGSKAGERMRREANGETGPTRTPER